MVNYLTQYLKVQDKKGKVVSNDIRLIAKQDKFISFNEMNELYKKIAAEYKTSQIQVLTTNPTGRKSMIKKIGDNVDDLTLEDEDYYNKLKKEDRKKFNEFTNVQFILRTTKHKKI